MNLVLAVEGGGFHVPPLEELFEFPPFLFGGTLFAFNKTALLYLLAAAIVCGLMWVAFKEPRIVPGKMQSAMESVVEFVREQIVIQVIGPDGLRFVPLLTALFLFIFVNNFFEITPLVQFPSTGRMALPAFLAIMVWILFILVGIKNQGGAYLKNTVVPPGVPLFVLPLVIPIEFVSTFIVRPLTLSVRLFANMMAGHILLAIIFIAANAFLLDFTSFPDVGGMLPSLLGFPLGIVSVAAGAAMVGFELLVGLLQAYIFTILTAVYIAGSMHPDH